ncbi:hypothetical protein ACFT38_40880 [Streptomyces sp. NPDC056975]|uniref:hypothetical protein n=1 Tax=Streptomyces sp. NPDC056975 TaxID=3345985 RepID=UPI003628FEAF
MVSRSPYGSGLQDIPFPEGRRQAIAAGTVMTSPFAPTIMTYTMRSGMGPVAAERAGTEGALRGF